MLLLFIPQLAYDLTHPTAPVGFVATLLVLISSGAAIAGGIVTFRQVSGGATAPSPRTLLVLAAVAGAVIGASLTSLAATGATGGGGAVAEAPTTTTTIQAKDTRWLETSLEMQNGEVLGIFVINRDAFGHSFDIDALNVHVSLPPNSTTAVAIKPAGAGQLEFYCGVPGHRPTMTGLLVVR